jgi:hypothetical protein
VLSEVCLRSSYLEWLLVSSVKRSIELSLTGTLISSSIGMLSAAFVCVCVVLRCRRIRQTASPPMIRRTTAAAAAIPAMMPMLRPSEGGTVADAEGSTRAGPVHVPEITSKIWIPFGTAPP